MPQWGIEALLDEEVPCSAVKASDNAGPDEKTVLGCRKGDDDRLKSLAMIPEVLAAKNTNVRPKTGKEILLDWTEDSFL